MFSSSVQTLRGIGKRQAENLERLGIETLQHLLTHYPHRWVDRREIRALGSLPRELVVEATPKPVVTVLGKVTARNARGRPGRRFRPVRGSRLEVDIRDDGAGARLVFFGGVWRESHFPVGATVLVSGSVGVFRGSLQFQNPEYEILSDEEEAAFFTGRLFPVYPLSRGLTQRQLRQWVQLVLEKLPDPCPDALPQEILKRHNLISWERAIRGIHFPESPDALHAARQRLVFDELFLDQLCVYAVRLRRERGKVAPVLQRGGSIFRRVRAALPFALTSDQDRALDQILDDLEQRRPMNRLLQGDVGSGKTVVAILAAAAAADAGVQTAFMVPTEILAEQHYRTLGRLGTPFGLEPRLLVGGMSAPARREVLRSFADGTAPLAVGTHALFQEGVRFRDLGLVVMDEQHRFGVVQRGALLEKGVAPHVLVMSATPIPRSLALVRYADLELSVLRERPAGRGKVITRVTPEAKRDAVYGFLAERLAEGRQAYVIYPLVEESDKSELRAATTMAEEIANRPEFRDFSVALLHGQMKAQEKDAVMQGFVDGQTQILVATTVVEVGIDVANASFMIIEHPERYGLSQLHQLRGRIGRGKHTSYCVLIGGEKLDGDAAARLDLFARIDDGFELSEADLSLRGQGDVSGTRQSGRPGFKLADPWRDAATTETARVEARGLLDSGVLDGDGGDEWELLHRRVRRFLEEAGTLVEAG